MKIGFIDYFLDEWHANNYPAWIRENAAETNRNADVTYAWAEMDKPGGLDTQSWCEKYHVQSLPSIDEVVEKSDCLIILSPDHPEHHERLSELALKSGKPVYMDKTFSPDLASGERMFALAEQHHTPLFSSSALRFARELAHYPNNDVNRDTLECVSTFGPGEYNNYSVHQFEMIVSLMGTGAKRIKSLSTQNGTHLIVEYGSGRQALFTQMSHLPFQVNIQLNDGEGIWIPQCSDVFALLIEAILTFFETGKPPVPKEETLEIMALIDAGKKALRARDTWITIEQY